MPKMPDWKELMNDELQKDCDPPQEKESWPDVSCNKENERSGKASAAEGVAGDCHESVEPPSLRSFPPLGVEPGAACAASVGQADACGAGSYKRALAKEVPTAEEVAAAVAVDAAAAAAVDEEEDDEDAAEEDDEEEPTAEEMDDDDAAEDEEEDGEETTLARLARLAAARLAARPSAGLDGPAEVAGSADDEQGDKEKARGPAKYDPAELSLSCYGERVEEKKPSAVEELTTEVLLLLDLEQVSSTAEVVHVLSQHFDVNSIRLPLDFLTATAGNVPVEFNMHLGTAEFAKILHKVLVRMVELRDELFKRADELGEDFTEDLLQRMQEDARAQVLGEVQVELATLDQRKNEQKAEAESKKLALDGNRRDLTALSAHKAELQGRLEALVDEIKEVENQQKEAQNAGNGIVDAYVKATRDEGATKVEHAVCVLKAATSEGAMLAASDCVTNFMKGKATEAIHNSELTQALDNVRTLEGNVRTALAEQADAEATTVAATAAHEQIIAEMNAQFQLEKISSWYDGMRAAAPSK